MSNNVISSIAKIDKHVYTIQHTLTVATVVKNGSGTGLFMDGVCIMQAAAHRPTELQLIDTLAAAMSTALKVPVQRIECVIPLNALPNWTWEKTIANIIQQRALLDSLATLTT